MLTISKMPRHNSNNNPRRQSSNFLDSLAISRHYLQNIYIQIFNKTNKSETNKTHQNLPQYLKNKLHVKDKPICYSVQLDFGLSLGRLW